MICSAHKIRRLNRCTYQWSVGFSTHVRECPWPFLVRPQAPSLHIIIHGNTLEGIHPPCYGERDKLSTLGQLAPWTRSLYLEFFILQQRKVEMQLVSSGIKNSFSLLSHHFTCHHVLPSDDSLSWKAFRINISPQPNPKINFQQACIRNSNFWI